MAKIVYPLDSLREKRKGGGLERFWANLVFRLTSALLFRSADGAGKLRARPRVTTYVATRGCLIEERNRQMNFVPRRINSLGLKLIEFFRNLFLENPISVNFDINLNQKPCSGGILNWLHV